MTDWIKRSDRMPGAGERVIVFFKDGSLGTIEWDSLFWSLQRVTHWMPLPDPPKRTVMVELDEADAKWCAQEWSGPSRTMTAVSEACRKALKELDR